MGNTSYNSTERGLRGQSAGYFSKSAEEIFTQQALKRAHESMKSLGLTIRECRDSVTHPNTVPIIIALDVTGSMGRIPHELIKDGLPTLMGTLIEKGVPDAAVCFIAIGDHLSDRVPLQAGQFESGDAELDMWLTRTYLEGNGGGNGGESYLLAWLFGAFYTSLDSFEKRNKKGFLITIGDEHNHKNLSASAIKEITGNGDVKNYSADELLELAQQKFNVFHINLSHSGYSSSESEILSRWKETLGEKCIDISDYKEVANTISSLVIKNVEAVNVNENNVVKPSLKNETKKDEVNDNILL